MKKLNLELDPSEYVHLAAALHIAIAHSEGDPTNRARYRAVLTKVDHQAEGQLSGGPRRRKAATISWDSVNSKWVVTCPDGTIERHAVRSQLERFLDDKDISR